MCFAESYLIDHSYFPDSTDGLKCGARNFQLDFVGGPYSFTSLTGLQMSLVKERFKDSCISPNSSRLSIQTSTSFLRNVLFKNVSFVGRDYVFDRGYDKFCTRIAGKNFLARIVTENEIHGELWLADNIGSGFLQVFENYFRILSAYRVLQLGGAVLHSGCVIYDDRAYLVLGRSGAGKSTFSRLAFEAGWEVLSDDLNAVLPDGEGNWWVERLPFAGDLGQTPIRGSSYPLAGIYKLRQSDSNNAHRLSKAQALAIALSCSPVVNEDPYRTDLLIDTLGMLVSSTDCGTIEFTIDGGALSILRDR